MTDRRAAIDARLRAVAESIARSKERDFEMIAMLEGKIQAKSGELAGLDPLSDRIPVLMAELDLLAEHTSFCRNQIAWAERVSGRMFARLDRRS